MAGRRKKNPEDLMITFTVRMPQELRDQLKDRARPAPISKVIRKLVRLYIRGEIQFDWTKEDDEEGES